MEIQRSARKIGARGEHPRESISGKARDSHFLKKSKDGSKRKIFVDYPDNNFKKKIESFLEKRGFIVEKFFCKNIDCVVSSYLASGSILPSEAAVSALQGPKGAWTRSPSALAVGSPSSLYGPSGDTQQPSSRGEAMVLKSRERNTEEPQNLVMKNAVLWKIPVMSLKKMEEILTKKLTARTTTTGKTVPVQKPRHKEYALRNFIKVVHRKGRRHCPSFCELDQWPKVDRTLRKYGAFVDCHVQSRPVWTRPQTIRPRKLMLSSRPGFPLQIPVGRTNLQSKRSADKAGIHARCMGVRREDKRKMFCELCHQKYEDLELHMQEEKHDRIMKSKSFWANLERKVAETNDFFKTLDSTRTGAKKSALWKARQVPDKCQEERAEKVTPSETVTTEKWTNVLHCPTSKVVQKKSVLPTRSLSKFSQKQMVFGDSNIGSLLFLGHSGQTSTLDSLPKVQGIQSSLPRHTETPEQGLDLNEKHVPLPLPVADTTEKETIVPENSAAKDCSGEVQEKSVQWYSAAVCKEIGATVQKPGKGLKRRTLQNFTPELECVNDDQQSGLEYLFDAPNCTTSVPAFSETNTENKLSQATFSVEKNSVCESSERKKNCHSLESSVSRGEVMLPAVLEKENSAAGEEKKDSYSTTSEVAKSKKKVNRRRKRRAGKSKKSSAVTQEEENGENRKGDENLPVEKDAKCCDVTENNEQLAEITASPSVEPVPGDVDDGKNTGKECPNSVGAQEEIVPEDSENKKTSKRLKRCKRSVSTHRRDRRHKKPDDPNSSAMTGSLPADLKKSSTRKTSQPSGRQPLQVSQRQPVSHGSTRAVSEIIISAGEIAQGTANPESIEDGTNDSVKTSVNTRLRDAFFTHMARNNPSSGLDTPVLSSVQEADPGNWTDAVLCPPASSWSKPEASLSPGVWREDYTTDPLLTPDSATLGATPSLAKPAAPSPGTSEDLYNAATSPLNPEESPDCGVGGASSQDPVEDADVKVLDFSGPRPNGIAEFADSQDAKRTGVEIRDQPSMEKVGQDQCRVGGDLIDFENVQMPPVGKEPDGDATGSVEEGREGDECLVVEETQNNGQKEAVLMKEPCVDKLGQSEEKDAKESGSCQLPWEVYSDETILLSSTHQLEIDSPPQCIVPYPPSPTMPAEEMHRESETEIEGLDSGKRVDCQLPSDPYSGETFSLSSDPQLQDGLQAHPVDSPEMSPAQDVQGEDRADEIQERLEVDCGKSADCEAPSELYSGETVLLSPAQHLHAESLVQNGGFESLSPVCTVDKGEEREGIEDLDELNGRETAECNLQSEFCPGAVVALSSHEKRQSEPLVQCFVSNSTSPTLEVVTESRKAKSRLSLSLSKKKGSRNWTKNVQKKQQSCPESIESVCEKERSLTDTLPAVSLNENELSLGQNSEGRAEESMPNGAERVRPTCGERLHNSCPNLSLSVATTWSTLSTQSLSAPSGCASGLTTSLRRVRGNIWKSVSKFQAKEDCEEAPSCRSEENHSAAVDIFPDTPRRRVRHKAGTANSPTSSSPKEKPESVCIPDVPIPQRKRSHGTEKTQLCMDAPRRKRRQSSGVSVCSPDPPCGIQHQTSATSDSCADTPLKKECPPFRASGTRKNTSAKKQHQFSAASDISMDAPPKNLSHPSDASVDPPPRKAKLPQSSRSRRRRQHQPSSTSDNATPGKRKRQCSGASGISMDTSQKRVCRPCEPASVGAITLYESTHHSSDAFDFSTDVSPGKICQVSGSSLVSKVTPRRKRNPSCSTTNVSTGRRTHQHSGSTDVPWESSGKRKRCGTADISVDSLRRRAPHLSGTEAIPAVSPKCRKRLLNSAVDLTRRRTVKTGHPSGETKAPIPSVNSMQLTTKSESCQCSESFSADEFVAHEVEEAPEGLSRVQTNAGREKAAKKTHLKRCNQRRVSRKKKALHVELPSSVGAMESGTGEKSLDLLSAVQEAAVMVKPRCEARDTRNKTDGTVCSSQQTSNAGRRHVEPYQSMEASRISASTQMTEKDLALPSPKGRVGQSKRPRCSNTGVVAETQAKKFLGMSLSQNHPDLESGIPCKSGFSVSSVRRSVMSRPAYKGKSESNFLPADVDFADDDENHFAATSIPSPGSRNPLAQALQNQLVSKTTETSMKPPLQNARTSSSWPQTPPHTSHSTTLPREQCFSPPRSRSNPQVVTVEDNCQHVNPSSTPSPGKSSHPLSLGLPSQNWPSSSFSPLRSSVLKSPERQTSAASNRGAPRYKVQFFKRESRAKKAGKPRTANVVNARSGVQLVLVTPDKKAVPVAKKS